MMKTAYEKRRVAKLRLEAALLRREADRLQREARSTWARVVSALLVWVGLTAMALGIFITISGPHAPQPSAPLQVTPTSVTPVGPQNPAPPGGVEPPEGGWHQCVRNEGPTWCPPSEPTTPTCVMSPHRDGCTWPDGPCPQQGPCVVIPSTPTTTPYNPGQHGDCWGGDDCHGGSTPVPPSTAPGLLCPTTSPKPDGTCTLQDWGINPTTPTPTEPTIPGVPGSRQGQAI